MPLTDNTELVVKIPYTDSFGKVEIDRKEGDVIRVSETQNVKFLLENKFIAFKITEDSFDFSKNWDELDADTIADFLKFTGNGFLSDVNRVYVTGMWEYYQMKNNMEV